MKIWQQGIAVFLILVILLTSSIRPTTAQSNFANCRLGVGGVGTDFTAFNTAQLNIGLFSNWWVNDPVPTGLSPEVDYIQTVRVHQAKEGSDWWGGGDYVDPPEYKTGPSLSRISQVAANRPGSLWIIGNEPDRRDFYASGSWRGQDEITPQLYAKAFHEIRATIKTADPTARIGIGSVVQGSVLRMKYLTKVWNSYQSRYGYSMGNDIDVWSIHGFILREDSSQAYGADIPTGLVQGSDYSPSQGFLYGENNSTLRQAHHNINYFKEFTQRLRSWMADHGERNKPLIVTEYGVLYKKLGGGEITDTQAGDYLKDSFNYLLNETDNQLGYVYDDNRLVQGWVWYSLNDTNWNGQLFNPNTKNLTTIGNAWKNYVSNSNKPLASQPRPDLLVTNLRSTPSQPQAPEGGTVAVTLKVDVANSGNTTTDTDNDLVVHFWNGPPNDPNSVKIGSKSIKDLPGCGQYTTVQQEWLVGGGEYTWYAEVESVSNETDTGDNVASRALSVAGPAVPNADLKIDSITASASVLTNETAQHTITIRNNGPETATNVVVDSVWQGAVSVKTVSSSQGSCNSSAPITCNLGTLATNGTATITIGVSSAQTGTLVNTASVSGAKADFTPGNNTQTAETEVREPEPGQVRFSSATYSVNEGTPNAVITVRRVQGSDGPVSVAYATNPGTAEAGSDYQAVSGTLTWADGDTANKTFTLPIMDDDVIEGNQLFSLALSNPTGGAALGNPNTATMVIEDDDSNPEPEDEIDLIVVQSDSPDPVEVGQTVEYQITVTNNGPDSATGVTLVNSLAGDVTVEDVTTSKGSCSGTTLITCNLNNLAKNGSATVNIEVTALTAGTIGNTATVNANENESSNGNNTAIAETTVNGQPVPGKLKLSQANYQILENGTEVSITVQRVQGSNGEVSVTYETSPGTAEAGSDYQAVSGTLSWAAGDDDSQTFTVPILNDDVVEGVELFSVTLSNPTGGATVGNPKTATVLIQDDDAEPERRVDLALDWLDLPTSAFVGQEIKTTITVYNNGPDEATAVWLTNVLSGSVTIGAVTTSQGECSQTPPLSCTLETLSMNSVATFTVSMMPTGAGVMTQAVTVGSQEADAVMEDNSSARTIIIESDENMVKTYLPLIFK